MRPLKISILAAANLSINPRVVKEADALAELGHDVTVVVPTVSEELLPWDAQILESARWKCYSVGSVLTRSGSLAKRLKSVQTRMSRRVGILAAAKLGVAPPGAFGYLTKELLKAALREQAELTIAHSSAGLWVIEQLSARGFQVGVDFEDWYWQLATEERHPSQLSAQLEKLEGKILRKARYCLTTSNAMAAALATHHQAATPRVMYNSFPEPRVIAAVGSDKLQPASISLHWFSQKLGLNRGLGSIFSALEQLPDTVELHIRAQATEQVKSELISLTSCPSRVIFHSIVSPLELPSRLAQHEIGLAIEDQSSVNRGLTITNKVFQYLQAGCVVIATPTAGQREIAAIAKDAVVLLEDFSDSALTQRLLRLVNDREELNYRRARAREISEQIFNKNKLTAGYAAEIGRVTAS